MIFWLHHNGPTRWTELRKDVGLTDRGLSNVLTRLIRAEIVTKEEKANTRPSYNLRAAWKKKNPALTRVLTRIGNLEMKGWAMRPDSPLGSKVYREASDMLRATYADTKSYAENDFQKALELQTLFEKIFPLYFEGSNLVRMLPELITLKSEEKDLALLLANNFKHRFSNIISKLIDILMDSSLDAAILLMELFDLPRMDRVKGEGEFPTAKRKDLQWWRNLVDNPNAPSGFNFKREPDKEPKTKSDA